MKLPDYYKILGVDESASQEAIKSAFRKLALKFHPDRNTGDEHNLEKFTLIQKAYEVLSDRQSRREYDNARIYSTKYSNLFHSKVVSHSNKIKLHIEKRVILPDDLIPVTIQVFDAGKNFHLGGISKFEVVEGPKIRSFSNTAGSPLLEICYLLRPKESGYIEVGPASFDSKGIRYQSDSVHIKVNIPPSEVTFRPFSKTEKAHTLLAVLVIITYLSLLAYNLYKYDIWPRIRPDKTIAYANLPAIRYGLNDRQLPTGFSPYRKYFGPEIYDSSSYNQIRFSNGKVYDAVVCLTDIKTGNTIRNNYIQAGEFFNMQNIPDGFYYLKVLFGNDWNSRKPLLQKEVFDSFNRDVRYEIFTNEHNLIDLHQSGKGDSLEYKIYEISLHPVNLEDEGTLLADEKAFFK